MEGKSLPSAKVAEGRLRRKPLAVLVKLAAGRSYTDTMRDLRMMSGLNPGDLGATVTTVRRTREGHVLLELTKGAKSQVVAGKLSEAISAKLEGSDGAVTQLDQAMEVEVVDIDEAANREEVLKVLRAAVPMEGVMYETRMVGTMVNTELLDVKQRTLMKLVNDLLEEADGLKMQAAKKVKAGEPESSRKPVTDSSTDTPVW